MESKPAFYGQEYASAFQDPDDADAYQFRPPYPAAVFDALVGLVVDEPRLVLDASCGTSLVARHLVHRVDGVDAVDVSRPKIERGQRLPNGDHTSLIWIVGTAEDAPLRPPYALITTGDSLQWMDWPVVMARFADLLTPGGQLAVLGVDQDLAHIP